ncbi:hypothetical protein [Streptomyces sp. CNQ085]|uniref:hypothetical protein n=1 Tax=Streptomyces sp. CNQ085 TaxID=2886944 RepID=UPI001F5089F2|nr:hypothetical protein [Streptomyces sp. CNQ085]MCI0384789.1 hypothetical protein [Streptomyces sp. CNQ085]
MRAPVARAAADLRLLRAAVFAAVCVTLSAAGHVSAAGQPLSVWVLLAGFVAVLATAVPLAGRERSLPGIAALLALGQTALHVLFSCGQTGHAASAGPTPATPDRSDGGVLALAGRLLCNDRAAAALSEAEARRIVADAGLPGGHTAAGPTAAGTADTVVGSAADYLRYAVHSALSLLSGPMLLGHLLAALATGWLLRRGDAALWRLVRLSAHFADRLGGGPLVRALRSAARCVRALLRGLLPEDAVPVRAPRADAYGGPVPPASLLPSHSVVRRGPPAAGRNLVLAA